MESKILNDRFRLVKLVGTGGMATVYQGHDLLLDRPVAIKILREPYASDPAFRDRFLEEARAAARLDHPHVVHIYDVGIDHEHPYIVMELVAGQDLKTIIRERAPLSIPQALEIARQICVGVGHAHRAGIVHCDVKPQNIMVTTKGEVKVADFGIARAFQEGQELHRQENVVWGSPHYISPEQAGGEAPTPASDVYSIGIILYEMLTGVPPFHAENTTALIIKHLHEEPAPPSTLNPRIPPRLEWLVRKVLSKQPAGRYRNADQFGMAIEEYQRNGEQHTAPHAVAGGRTPPPPPQLPPHPERPDTQPVQAETDQELEPQESGPDWFLWALWGVAAIAVLGLIPLWLYVYRAYTQPLVPPPAVTVTATATPSGPTVGVPNLIGLSAADAQRLAEGYNLEFNIASERETNDALPGTILEQQPHPGAQVPADTTIDVLVAAGAQLTLPNLVGYQADIIVPNLETQGLIVVQQEIWSDEVKGQILEQVPIPDSSLKAGDTITLTLSGGAEKAIPLQVNLNNLIMLEEALIPQRPFRPGDSVPVTLRWRALRSVDSAYTVFLHLVPLDSTTPIAQHDGQPGNGTNPTTSWQPGEIIIDPHQIIAPNNTPAGTYQLRVGLYTGENRLQVIDSGKTKSADNSIFVANVEIAP